MLCFVAPKVKAPLLGESIFGSPKRLTFNYVVERHLSQFTIVTLFVRCLFFVPGEYVYVSGLRNGLLLLLAFPCFFYD